MGKIYEIESVLRELCTDPITNSEELYNKICELVRRLLNRNTSKVGPDIDRYTLGHEIASYIITRLCEGSLEPIYCWSGYIMKILPRMLKSNAKMNGTCTDYVYDIDPKSIMEMGSGGR